MLRFSRFNHLNTKQDNTKISVRNQIKGTVNAVVAICHGNHNPIKADITMESVKQLELAEGKECYAVIKATNVMFATKRSQTFPLAIRSRALLLP